MHLSALLFAVVLSLQCSSAAPTNLPADSEKLDLNAISAVVEFGLKNALHVRSSYGLAIDGDLGVGWAECAASNKLSSGLTFEAFIVLTVFRFYYVIIMPLAEPYIETDI